MPELTAPDTPVEAPAETPAPTGDIVDPPVPGEVAAAMACQPALDELRQLLKQEPLDLEKFENHVFMILDITCKTMLADCQSRLNQLTQQAPLYEEAHITAVTPSGYPTTIVTRRASPGELIESVVKIQAWLQSAGYRPPVPAP